MNLMSDESPTMLRDSRCYLGLGFISVAACCVAWYTGWGPIPIILRFLAGLISFGVSPGFLLLLALNGTGGRKMDLATTFLSAITFSFSCNLILNVVLFATQASLRTVAITYLTGQLVAYLALGALWAANRSRFWGLAANQPAMVAPNKVSLAAWLALSAAFVGLLVSLYQQGAAPVNPEELVVLRKLVDNPAVRHDNISIAAAETSTYFFVPFQVFVAATSLASDVDVAFAYSVFWAFTTLVSTVAIIKLVHEVTGDDLAAGFTAVVVLAISVADANGLIYGLGLFLPYPNRYGFAGGVLLPINLLMVISLLKQERLSPMYLFLLIYTTIEMTFVHARETLFFLGWLLAVMLVLLVDFRARKQQIGRLALAVGLTGLILVGYKFANLALSSSLNDYVGLLTQETRQALAKLINEHGVWGALFTEGPSEVVIRWTAGNGSMSTQVATYAEVFEKTWTSMDYPSRILLPLCLLCLPAYAALARSSVELGIALAVSMLGLVLQSGLLKLGIAAVVGNPEILACHNIVFLMAFCVVPRMACVGAFGIEKCCQGSRQRSITVLAIVAAGILVAGFAPAKWLGGCQWVFRSVSDAGVLRWLHAVTLGVILFKCRKSIVSLLPSARLPAPAARTRPAFLFVTGAALLLVCPWIMHSRCWKGKHFQARAKIYGEFAKDYDALCRVGRLPSSYPLPLVAFMRNNLRPNQIVLAKDTFSVVLTTNHFAALLASAGDSQVPVHFVMNWKYLLHHQHQPGHFHLPDFLDPQHGFLELRRLVGDLHVDVVVVSPAELPGLLAAQSQHPELAEILRPAYAGDGFAVYEVCKTVTSDAELTGRASTNHR